MVLNKGGDKEWCIISASIWHCRFSKLVRVRLLIQGKLKSFVNQRTLSLKRKDKLDNRRRPLQIIYMISVSV